MPVPSTSRRAYQGKHVAVDEEEWPAIGSWEVVRPLDAVGILPILGAKDVPPTGPAISAIAGNEDVLLVRQFRPAVREHSLEIPAGLLDVEGEEVAVCAVRELFEETGYMHKRLDPLVSFQASAGHSSEVVHLFLALVEDEPRKGPERGIELVRRPFDEMVREVRADRVKDAKTALALLIADAKRTAG